MADLPKKLKVLWDNAESLSEKEEWDTAIHAYMDLWVLIEKDASITATFKADICCKIGFLHSKKDEFDQAIVFLNKALELQPDHRYARGHRGRAYYRKDKYAHAITDCTDALKMYPDDHGLYMYRGLAYESTNQFDLAIADFSKAIEEYLGHPELFVLYHYRGSIYHKKGDYDRAIADYDKAIALHKQPDTAQHSNIGDIYHRRARAHIFKKKAAAALKDFQKAIEHKPSLAFKDPFCHIANSVYNEVAFKHLTSILALVQEIKKVCIWKPSKNLHPIAHIAHYTGLKTLRNLASGDPFRLYNADYMNDLAEGETFLKIVDNHIGRTDRQKIYSDKDKNPLSPAYVGSFARAEHGLKDGKLLLWRTYGKNEEVEAAGACIHFDISQFSNEPFPSIGPMQQHADRASRLEVYRVAYEDEIQKDPLRSELEKLMGVLKNSMQQTWSSDKEEHNVYRVTRELLDEIRFLFKSNHYQEEQELRIVQLRYVHADVQSGDDDDVKIDVDRLPPRFYLEAKNLELKETILGPMAQSNAEWTRWLKEQNSAINVHKSTIPYGKK